MWSANSRDVNTVDYCIWGMMRMHTNYQDAHELRHRLVETWVEFQKSVLDDAINQW